MMMSDLKAEVEIWPFHACAVHPAIIIRSVQTLWTWLWGRYLSFSFGVDYVQR